MEKAQSGRTARTGERESLLAGWARAARGRHEAGRDDKVEVAKKEEEGKTQLKTKLRTQETTETQHLGSNSGELGLCPTPAVSLSENPNLALGLLQLAPARLPWEMPQITW